MRIKDEGDQTIPEDGRLGSVLKDNSHIKTRPFEHYKEKSPDEEPNISVISTNTQMNILERNSAAEFEIQFEIDDKNTESGKKGKLKLKKLQERIMETEHKMNKYTGSEGVSPHIGDENMEEFEEEGEAKAYCVCSPKYKKECCESWCLIVIALYLVFQVTLETFFPFYFYYILEEWMAIGYTVTMVVSLIKSTTALFGLFILTKDSIEICLKYWIYYRNIFYVTIGLHILASVILMLIIPFRISLIMNSRFFLVLVISALDFVIFLTMGILGACSIESILNLHRPPADHHI